MDVFSHGLWAGAAYKSANLKPENKLKVRMAVIWGVFPDIFAFSISFLYIGLVRMMGGDVPGLAQPHEIEPPIGSQPFIMRLTHYLYDASHSLFVFLVIFGLVAWYFKKPVWEMGAWGLHILMDIPTHSFAFFPTPFLWPIFSYKFNGIHWASLRFESINFSLIILAYFVIWIANKWKKKAIQLEK